MMVYLAQQNAGPSREAGLRIWRENDVRQNVCNKHKNYKSSTSRPAYLILLAHKYRKTHMALNMKLVLFEQSIIYFRDRESTR